MEQYVCTLQISRKCSEREGRLEDAAFIGGCKGLRKGDGPVACATCKTSQRRVKAKRKFDGALYFCLNFFCFENN